MSAVAAFEAKQEKARRARSEAAELRRLHGIATCGLDMRYRHEHHHTGPTYINHGTYTVPDRIALRVADQYPIWAAEYDAIADRIDAELAAALAVRTLPETTADGMFAIIGDVQYVRVDATLPETEGQR